MCAHMYCYCFSNCFNDCDPTQIIISNIIHLFAHSQVVSSFAIQHKLFYSTLFIYLHILKWFQQLLRDSNNSICIQVSSFKYSTLIVLFA